MRRVVLGLAALAVTTSGLLAGPPPVAAAGACGGVVFVDLDADGERREAHARGTAPDVLEPGVADVLVTVTDRDGTAHGTVTDASGEWRVAVPAARFPVRIDVRPPAGWSDSATGPSNPSRRAFAAAPGDCGEHAVGLVDPTAYCAAQAPVVVACHARADAPDASPAEPAVRLVTATTRDTGRTDAERDGEWLDQPTEVLATTAAIGTVHGLAAARDGRVFAGAFVKRHTALVSELNPTGNPTAIFELTADRPPRVLTVLDPTATDPHRVAGRAVAHDAAAMDDVFRAGIGDLELSVDGRQLYAVDLGRRALVTIDPDDGTTLATTPLDGIRLGIDGCGVTAAAPYGDLRPFGLGLDADGDLLIGVVCTSGPDHPTGHVVERTGDRFHLRLTWPLAGRRGDAAEGGGPARDAVWRTWVDRSPFATDEQIAAYPQPAITDLLVDADGHLAIAIGDRWSHQTAPRSEVPAATGTHRIEEPVAAGDLQRACAVGDRWVIEGSGTCRGGIGDGWEFYAGDRYGWHAETALGALAGAPGRPDLIATHIDPIPADGTWHSGGLAWHATATGDRLDGLRLYDGRRTPPGGTFEHTAGLGDVELLCGELPIVLGGRIWHDVDADGVPDPTEPPIAGVPLELLDPNGREIGHARTTVDGRYQFDTRALDDGPDRGKRYTIVVTEDAFRGGVFGPDGPWTGLRPLAPQPSGRIEVAVIAGDDPSTPVIEPPVRQDLDVAMIDQYDLAVHASLAARDADLDVLDIDAIVTNQGSLPSGAFTVEGRIPPGTVLVAAGDAERPATVLGDRVTWHVPSGAGLAPGEWARLPIRVRVGGRGTTELVYTVQITAADGRDDDSTPGDALLEHPATLAAIEPGPVPVDRFGASARDDDSGALSIRLSTLAGSIWFDADRDGRRDLDPGAVERLAAGVDVRLLRGDGTEFARTVTDADGWYEFPLLETGTYRIEVPATNFAGPLQGYDVIVRPGGSLVAADAGYVSGPIELVAGRSAPVTHLGVAHRPPRPFLGGAGPLLIGPGLVLGTWRMLERQRRGTRYG